ncbi:reverse transcriptase domain-containing protein [Tanacetum coccineum]
MFKKLHFNISLAEALALMPKYHKMLKYLLYDKEKLLGLANTSLTENCSAVLLKKLPEKLGDPGKFLIPCDFLELEKCMTLADLAGIDEDIFVQVGKFTFPADFVIVEYDVDPRVPLILGRPFLRTVGALVDVYEEELILRDGDEKLIFHADSTSKHPHKHGNKSINMINFIDISCEDRFNEIFSLLIELNNNPEEDILFLKFIKGVEPIIDTVPERSEIYTLIREPPDTFIIGDEEIKFYPFKDIDDLVLIPKVFETPLDFFDSSLDSFDTAFTNPLFELDSEYTLNYDNPIFDIQNGIMMLSKQRP